MEKIQDTGYKIQDTRYKIQDTGYKIQDTGCKILDIIADQIMFFKRNNHELHK